MNFSWLVLPLRGPDHELNNSLPTNICPPPPPPLYDKLYGAVYLFLGKSDEFSLHGKVLEHLVVGLEAEGMLEVEVSKNKQ